MSFLSASFKKSAPANQRPPLDTQLHHPWLLFLRVIWVLLERAAVALRGTFLIDRQGIVRSALLNDLPLGRSIDETLRLLDALKHVEQYGEMCPVNWHEGERAMQATTEGLNEFIQAVAG